jgi:hypothetical protein
MTVLAHVWTPEGFVVGADGRGWIGTDCIDDLKKLIRLTGPGVNLICGFSGATRIGSFDLSEETKNIGGLLSGQHLGEQYIEGFAESLRRHFTDEINAEFKKHSTFALLVGYVKNRPQWWVCRMGANFRPEKKLPMDRYSCVMTGHDDCGKLLFTAHSLREGEDGLRRYIECCIAHDDKYGGEIQIETIPCPVKSNHL